MNGPVATNRAPTRCLLAGAILAALGPVLAAGEWQCDGHWLRFRGRPLLLVGDSITQGWMELGAGFDQRAYVDALARRGINALLLWSYIGIVDQSADNRIGHDAPEIWPWVRVARAPGSEAGPPSNGAGPFDLARFNDAYFERLRELVRCADANGIVVVVQVHDGWTKTKFAGHPFNVANGGPLTDKAQYVELHDYHHEMPSLYDPQWTRPQRHQFYLERFCERLLRAIADTPNVMFEIFNEGEWYDAPRLRAFQMHFLEFFQARSRQPLIINDDHIRGVPGFRGEPKADVLSHHTPRWDDLPPAQVFFDHYRREFDAAPAKPLFFSEPVPSYAGGDAATEAALLRLLWGTALAGASVVVQNDASYGFDPRSALAAQVTLRDRVLDLEGHLARFFHCAGVNFAAMKPDGQLASTGVCLADVGIEYVVYAPPGPAFTVDLATTRDTIFGVRWYDPRTGRFQEGSPITGGNAAQPFTPPWPGDAVLHLQDARRGLGASRTRTDAVARMPAGGSATEGTGRAVEQPELKEALEHAPLLQTESLGEPARGVNVWERWFVPNPDGRSWDVLQIYFKEYYGPTWLYAVDLGTGQVKKQRLADGHQFYLSGRALGFDGQYYIATPSRKTWSMDLFVYDPATNAVEERGEIVPGLGGEVRPLVTGPDGRIYGTGTRDNRVGLYIYDPKLGKVVRDFGPVGPRHPNGAWSRYVMGVDDTHAYIASGMIPAWYLVAVNLATGEEKVLLESPTERVMDIIESFPGAYARVPQEGGAPDKEYWLHHGQAIPQVNDTPPWPRRASPWDKALPRPEVYFDQIDPDAEGNATLWYRSRDDAAKAPRNPSQDVEPQVLGWKAVRLEGVPSYPHRINPLSVLPDGRLYGTGDDYAGVFVFDPRTDQTTILGPRPGLAPYTQIVYGGKLYSSGYSGGHLFVYDPARPWTLSQGGPPGRPALDQADARSNPRYLGDFDRTTRVGLMHSSAVGADGRIYFGGFGLRHYTGGGFGWYDPQTQKMDGFWKPLSGYAVQWIAPALDGRLIVISTIRAADELDENRVPEEAGLFVYDVSEQKIVRKIVPVAKARTTGLIAEVTRGRLLGLTSDPQQSGRSILYGVDVITGEVLFTKDLPSPVSVDDYWPHWVDPSYEYNAFVRGPDGFVWTFLKNVLVRIDPQDARVHVVGRIEPVGWPTFVGNDAYFSGPEQLRRIRHLVP